MPLWWLYASLALLLRWGVSLWPHSGQGVAPMFGDYEAQRHWMEITTNLPLSEWYEQTQSNDLLYWGLDYPPLTAYHSFSLGHASNLVNSSWTALHSSRGEESSQHRLFMRATVLVTDLIVFLPAVYMVALGRKEVVAALLSLPPLILIDHGHFQYNSASLGLFLMAVAALMRGKDLTGSLLFVLALNYKQMELYHALPIFFYLLGLCWKKPTITSRCLKLSSIGATVICTFALVWAPFIFLGSDSVLQVLKRCFPFGRGLFEDKVANFWCSLDVLVKLKHTLSIPDLAKLSGGVTLLLALPANLHLLIRPNISNLVLSLTSTALAFFLFSFQVHEKSILLAVVPAVLLYGEAPSLRITIPWFTTVATFSMMPLLLKDGLFLPSVALSVLHLTLMHNLDDLLPKTFDMRRPQSPTPSLPSTTFELLLKATMVISLLGCTTITVLSVTVAPPVKYPFLWPLVTSVYGAGHFILFFIYLLYIQIFATSSPTSPTKKTN